MSAETHSEENEEGFLKVVKDLGLTPGNDRALTLSCGHTILVDVSHSSDGGPLGSWEGGFWPCYSCDKENS